MIFRAFCGREGLVGASAGSTTRMLLDRKPAVMPASFQFLLQAIVELLIGIGIVLENVVLHQFFRLIVRFGFLPVERLLEQLHMASRGFVVLLRCLPPLSCACS